MHKMTNTTMNVSLPEELKARVKERMAEDHYSTASDYIQALIRQDVAKTAAAKRLEQLLEQGMNSGIAKESSEELFRALREHLSNNT